MSATLSGPGNLRLGWSSNNGMTNGQSTCNLTLTPGTSYHLAAVWQSGSQRYFVNGVEVASDAQTGSLGVLGDAAPHSFRLGSDSAGTDVTLDEPTLWVGYALSDQDVGNLRDRIVHPEGIAPASIALEWSLAGPDGVAAQVGDAGLADSSATGLNLSSIVGSAPTYQAGVLSYAPIEMIGSATVSPSGQSIIVVVEDGTGAPANVKSLRSTNNVQLLSLSGSPAGGGFTLTFGGQTTAPIAVATNPPRAYGLLTIPVAAGVAQQIAVTWNNGSNLSTDEHFEIFDTDGTTLLASTDCDFTKVPSSFQDGTSPNGGGVNWQNLATVTPTGATVTIRVTSLAGTLFVVSGVRVLNTVTSALTYFSDRTPGAYKVVGTTADQNNGQGWWYNGENTSATGTGIGTRYTADPAAIQAALLALSSVQAGGLRVTAADSDNSPPYTIAFDGPMGGASQPSLVASDPAIVPSIVNEGGDYPSISINGGPPIPLKAPVWGARLPNGAGTTPIAPYLPYILWNLPQSAPDSQTIGAGDGLFAFTGSYNYGPPGASNPTTLITGSGTATWTFPCQPAGSYRVAVTWPAGAGLSTAAVYSVTSNPSGSTASTALATVTVDQTQAPAEFTADGFGWKTLGTFTVASNTDIVVTASAGSASVIADTARLDRTSPDTSIVIRPTDVVTFSASDGWATSTVGPVPAASGVPVANSVGGSILPAIDPSSVTMRVGYNITGAQPFGFLPIYANIAKGIEWGTDYYSLDANRYPLTLNSSQIQILVSAPAQDTHGAGKGLANLPNGKYTFLWDGASTIGLYPGGDTGMTVVQSNLTGGADNKIVATFTSGPSSYSPGINLYLRGTTPDPTDPAGKRYLCDFRNLRIYPPDPSDPTGQTPWSNPPKFHPTFLSKLAGAQSIRFLDCLNTNSNNVVNYADFPPPGRISYFDAIPIYAEIASIVPYTGGRSGTDEINAVVLLFTTTAPHGLATGQQGSIGPNGNTPSGTIEASNGSYSLSFPAVGLSGGVTVLSPTTFTLSVYGDSSHPGRVMTNSLAGAECGIFSCGVGAGGFAFEDAADLCNQVGADMYLNVPCEATDACVTTMADFVVANLRPGLKCRVEYSNECWNFGFPGYAYCCQQSVLILGKGTNYYVPYYTYRAIQVHNVFASAFAAAGRSGDFVAVMGSQGAGGEYTQAICQYAAGARIDELAVATYLDNTSVLNGAEPTLGPTYDLMTTGQILDLFELNILYGRTETLSSGHRSILDAANYTATRIINYEGGPDYILPGSSTANTFQRSHAAIRHPRMFGIMLGFLQKLQGAGVSLFNDYAMNYYAGPPVWGAYYGWNMQPGTGDPVRDAINITDPEAIDQIKSEVGGAISLWAKYSAGSPPPKPKRPIPPQLKAIGYRRGMSGPAR